MPVCVTHDSQVAVFGGVGRFTTTRGERFNEVGSFTPERSGPVTITCEGGEADALLTTGKPYDYVAAAKLGLLMAAGVFVGVIASITLVIGLVLYSATAPPKWAVHLADTHHP